VTVGSASMAGFCDYECLRLTKFYFECESYLLREYRTLNGLRDINAENLNFGSLAGRDFASGVF